MVDFFFLQNITITQSFYANMYDFVSIFRLLKIGASNIILKDFFN